MEIELKESILISARKEFPENPIFEENDYSWSKEKTVDSKFLSKQEIKFIISEFEKIEREEENIHNRKQIKKLKSLQNLFSNGQKKIVNLESMTEAVKMEVMKLKNHFLFTEDEVSKEFVPYFIKNISYYKRDIRRGVEPHTRLEGVFVLRGEQKSRYFTIRREDLGKQGCSAIEALNNIGLSLETEGLMEEYQAFIKKYQQLSKETGLQLIGKGGAILFDTEPQYRSSNNFVNMSKGGSDSRLVVDDQHDIENKNLDDSCTPFVSTDFWNTNCGEDGEEKDIYRAPVHPFLRVFDLKTHRFLLTHVCNVEKYIYEEGLENKLVLENNKKEIIDMLTSSGGDDSKDIIQGKSGGVIVITSGPPGTGKTLTSEVYSEKIKRPLYVVQCSQLGTDPESLEEKLQEVLDRSIRWGAILLIDEADVYIHERGQSIKQNAIVGVFLRVLEYYSGVLFLTTNRETVIDDAIISRAIAHIRYELPSTENRIALWEVLSKQYNVEITYENCKLLSEIFPTVSGRSIKQLIRLSKALANNRGTPVSIEIIKSVSKFQNIE